MWRPAGVVLALVLFLAACNNSQPSAVTGPGFSPPPTAPVQVVINGCRQVKGFEQGDIDYLHSQLVRQQSELQRIDDDVSGAVPGGDLTTDTQLALTDAKSLVGRIKTSTICDKVRKPLLLKAATLAANDSALAAAANSSGDVAGALKLSQGAYEDLRAAVDAIH